MDEVNLVIKPFQTMFALMNKRIAIISLFFLAYGALLAHNLVPHTHLEHEVEHHSGHHHHGHDEQDEEKSLSLLLAEVVHLPGSNDSYVTHVTSSFFKISICQFILPTWELSFKPPVNASSKYPPSFREERILSFSVTNALLRAPPVA
jgi:hypothetical protein